MVDNFNEILDCYNGLENNCTSVNIFVLADIVFSLSITHVCAVIWADEELLSLRIYNGLLFRYNGILISYSELVYRYNKILHLYNKLVDCYNG